MFIFKIKKLKLITVNIKLFKIILFSKLTKNKLHFKRQESRNSSLNPAFLCLVVGHGV